MNELEIPKEIQDYVFRLEVEVQDKGKISADVTSYLNVDETMLENAILVESKARYFWGVIYADLRTQISKMDRALRARRGAVRKTIVESLNKDGVKVTEKLVDSLVDSDMELLALEEKIDDIWNKANRVSELTKAIDMRHEDLRSLISLKKQERANL